MGPPVAAQSLGAKLRATRRMAIAFCRCVRTEEALMPASKGLKFKS